MDIIQIHNNHPQIVEHSTWILGQVEYKPAIDKSKLSESRLHQSSLVRPESSDNFDHAIIQATTLTDVLHHPVVNTSATSESKVSSESTEPSKHIITTREFYTNPAYWDMFYSALRTHRSKSNTFACVCSAITMFSNKGRIAHSGICDLFVSVLDQHVDDKHELFRILETVGALARTNSENNQRFSDANTTEIIDLIISGLGEGSTVSPGLLQAIAGLAENNIENQEAFHLSPHVCLGIANILYNDLETDTISLHGCQAISALTKDFPKNQMKLSSVCTYVADIINYHKSNPTILLEATKTISYLAHKNNKNRNRLGSSDVCSSLVNILKGCIDEQMTISWRKHDSTLVFWMVKALGNLAANNPTNQTKLGNHGACELLVKVLTRTSIEGQKVQEAKVFSNVLWAIGNLVQLGKGASMLIQDDVESNANGDNSPYSERERNASTATNVVTLNSGRKGKKTEKNTTRFLEADIAALLKKVIFDYIDYSDVALWSARAINNLSKSQRLRLALTDAGIFDALQGMIEKYTNYTKNQDVVEWANMAKESLTSGNN